VNPGLKGETWDSPVELSKQFTNTGIEEHTANYTDADCNPDAYPLGLICLEITDPCEDENRKAYE
jgi:hypothetical protein